MNGVATVGFIVIAILFIGLYFRAYVVSAIAGIGFIFIGYLVQRVTLGSAVPHGDPIETGIIVILMGTGILISLFSAGKLFNNTDGKSFSQRAFGTGKTEYYTHDADKTVRHYNINSPDADERSIAYRMQVRDRMNKYQRRK